MKTTHEWEPNDIKGGTMLKTKNGTGLIIGTSNLNDSRGNVFLLLRMNDGYVQTDYLDAETMATFLNSQNIGPM